MTPETIREKIYAGIIGKAVGVRLGAPVEPTIWDHDRILATYGEIDDYVRDYRTFAADDDTNGPFYFVRALWDEAELTPQAMGRAWLNYTGDGHGMFWWGGVGISTEHTAYEHLKAGMQPPETGSIATNGRVAAEQIGGQIFVDCWGWVNPGDPVAAARQARIAASVSHDGEALEGAAYVAAATAAAFDAPDIHAVHAAARALVANGSHYARVVDAVEAFHEAETEDWRACFRMLEREFGYDRWPGICHVIPNAGVMALALLYGRGDMPRTACIATMCGWDTDCNAGNAAGIAGVLQGVQPHWAHWRRPINDTLTVSGVTGALNNVDMPSFARDLAVLALRQRGEPAPDGWEALAWKRGVAFDFALPGATHGLQVEGSHRLRTMPGLRGDALAVQIDRWAPGDGGRLHWKPFHRRADFDDDRYRPMPVPVAASGQTVRLRLRGGEVLEGPRQVHAVPYVRLATSRTDVMLGDWRLLPEGTEDWTFELPETDEAIDEIGLLMEQRGDARVAMYLDVLAFDLGGPGHVAIDPALEAAEWGSVSRFTFNRGRWGVAGGAITGEAETDADLWTGHVHATDQVVTAGIVAEAGTSHLLTARCTGTQRFYAGGIEDGRAVLLAHDFGREVLAETTCDATGAMELELQAEGDRLTLRIDGREVLTATDARHPRGQAGLRMAAPGRMRCTRFEIREG